MKINEHSNVKFQRLRKKKKNTVENGFLSKATQGIQTMNPST